MVTKIVEVNYDVSSFSDHATDQISFSFNKETCVVSVTKARQFVIRINCPLPIIETRRLDFITSFLHSKGKDGHSTSMHLGTAICNHTEVNTLSVRPPIWSG